MSMDIGLDIAQSLTAIVVLWRDLEDEALHRYADKELPGGDALVMLGPVANMEAYGYRQLSEMMGRTNAKGGEDDDFTDDAPPLLVLAGWTEVIRAERALEPERKRASVTREADFIRASIDWMLVEDENGTPNFMPADELARELRRVVARLENVLKAGERDDKGAPCMKCGHAQIKVWGAEAHADRWHCKTCGLWPTPDEYNLSVRQNYLKESKRLNATDMLEQYRIKQGTLTGWASKGLVARRGKDGSGRILYDVDQAVAQRDGKDDAA